MQKLQKSIEIFQSYDKQVAQLSQRDRAAGGLVMAKSGRLERRDNYACLLYTSPSPRDRQKSRMPSSA